MKTMAVGGAAAGGLMLAGQKIGARSAEASNIKKPGNHHLAWVWQFDDDGAPEEIRGRLAYYGMGIVLKSHDATTWMARWDESGWAIDGGQKVRELADFFEYGGVPFHAWCVVKGLDPIREAQMCAEVLANGARSMVIDLEPSDGGSFWQGTPEAALEFGRELRRWQPDAFVSFAPDPRPWQVEVLPCREFASFCNEIAPQTYWPMFNSPANYRLLGERGFYVGPEGVTPQSVLDITKQVFADYGLPIKPIGSGNSDLLAWEHFVGHAHAYGMPAVSVWRFGTSRPEIWDVFTRARPQYNEYYGTDWAPPVAQSVKAEPEKLGSMPQIAPPSDRNIRVQATVAQEATSSEQGVSDDLEAIAKRNPISSAASKAESRKSFWADPLKKRGGR